MKILFNILKLILYIGVFALITFFLYKKLHNKSKKFQLFVIIAINLIGIFPLFALVNYSFLLSSPFLDFIASIGFIFAGFLMYFILPLLILYLFILIFNKLSKKYKINVKNNKFQIISLSIISCLSIGVCTYGYIAATAYDIDTKYVESDIAGLKIATLSDIHYGTICSTLQKEKLINQVNNANVDLVFLVGDVFDNHIERLDKQDFTTFIDSFTSTYGTYAVLGNHELKQNKWEDAISFYSDSKVKLLVDEEVIIDNKIRIAGRDDFSNKNRKKLNEFISSSSLPLIVLDHQPGQYKEAKDAGAVIQYSGHTHNGQLFPYNLFVGIYHKIKYDCPIDGVTKYDNFYLIICRGTSNWGFPYKTTGSAQIIITLEKSQ